ncbi:unnamed protein product [Symbiodinium natans]|uniref:Nitronate monooxygenase n=1 Tax=Symbiodinium natans TaxID=878477 RepID=A0A812PZM7_9DINO|nr:unnamed protein product [Symbiodinium natans]
MALPRSSALAPAKAFCEAFGLRCPVIMAPMAGSSPVALAAAVANAGGMGSCGVLAMGPEQILQWTSEFRAKSQGQLQLNTWVPDPSPHRDAAKEQRVREFLARWGPEVPADAGDATIVDFDAQVAAMIEARPAVISSIMGLYSAKHVEQMKAHGIKWFAVATTVHEALAAEGAGADAIVAQGMEAGGHRGAFKAEDAARDLVGLFSLLPAIVDAVRVPVIATGGVADARGAAAAFALGASAVQMGTGLLRSPEAAIPRVWADALGTSRPEDTVASRAFSGRLGRSLKTAYTVASLAPEAPEPAPYPVQRGLTTPMRVQAAKDQRLESMMAWAGQSAGLASAKPAAEIVAEVWAGSQDILGAVPDSKY